jgi:hypothetical protein
MYVVEEGDDLVYHVCSEPPKGVVLDKLIVQTTQAVKGFNWRDLKESVLNSIWKLSYPIVVNLESHIQGQGTEG